MIMIMKNYKDRDNNNNNNSDNNYYYHYFSIEMNF